MGGDILVASERQKGSRFTLILPRSPSGTVEAPLN
jgi:signal transduction histidine kinase